MARTTGLNATLGASGWEVPQLMDLTGHAAEHAAMGVGVVIRASGGATGDADIAAITNAGAVVEALGGGNVVIDGALVINAPIPIRDNVAYVLNNGASITAPDAFSVSITTVSGSTTASISASDANAGRVKEKYWVSGTGIADFTRVVSVSGATLELGRAATASGTTSATFYPIFNFFEGTAKHNWSIMCPNGWATIDGNLDAQLNLWLAEYDNDGSAFNVVNCYDYHVSGLKCINHHFHGGYFRSTQSATEASQRSSITRMQFKNNGVRGLHARATGVSGTWPGIEDVWIDDIHLETNGRMWPFVQGAAGYDANNSGLFVHVGGMRRVNVGKVTAKNEWGVAAAMIGDDSANSQWSEHLSFGTLHAQNCGRGAYLSQGIKNTKFEHIDHSCFFARSSTGTGCNTSTIREFPVRSLEDGSVNYMAVCDMVLPSSLTAAQLAQIRVGMFVLMSNAATGNLLTGNVIAEWNLATRTATVWAYADPLANTTDDADGLCASQTPAAAGDLTINGAQTTVGASNYSLPRKISIYSGGAANGVTFTVTGTDYAGAALVETVTGPNATTVWTKRLFSTVTQVAVSGGTGVAVTVGTGLARPITTTASNGSVAIRGSRDGALYLAHSGSASGDIEGIDVGSLTAVGCPGYPVKTSPSSSGFKTRDLHIGHLRCVNTHNLWSIDSAEGVVIDSTFVQDVGRAYNADDGQTIGYILGSTKGMQTGPITHIQGTAYTLTGPLVDIHSSCSAIRIGKVLSSGSATGRLRNDAATDISFDDPRDYATLAQLTVAAGNITGSGTTRILNAT